MEPIPIPITPKILFLGFKNKTRPPYSPILFGVKIAQANPENTDSIALLIEMGWNCKHIYFHFKASTIQFINIKAKTNVKEAKITSLEMDESRTLKSNNAVFFVSKR